MVTPKNRLIHIQLDESSAVRRRPEVEQERAIAIFDLLEENCFAPIGDDQGPYALHLSVEDNRLVLDIRTQDGQMVQVVSLPVKQFQSLIKDYFLICESYYAAIRHSTPAQIEAIDVGRRGLHNEGSNMLKERLADKIDLDFDTARRLFTLVCILHIRG
jgi:uncharacterized protein (UPF0262 family)